MVKFLDARVPVVFGAMPEAADAVLAAEPGWGVVHPAGCTCCAARGPAALALDRLFIGRVRGTIPWFTRVVVDPAGEAAVRGALADDAMIAGRFRLG